MFRGLLRKPVVWFTGLLLGAIAWLLCFGLGWLPSNKVRYFLLLPLAWLLYQLLPGKKAQIKNNLKLIFPHYSEAQLENGAWENVKTLLLSWSSILNIKGSHRKNVRDLITGEEKLLEAVNSGRKVVITITHVGNVNELSSAVAALGLQAFVPAEAIPYPLFKLMNGSRSRAGNVEFAAIRKGETIKTCAKKLAEGKVVVLAIDMPPGQKGRGYWLQVGRATTEVQLGAVKLALQENAQMFMAQIYWEKKDPLINLIPFKLDITANKGRDLESNSRRLLSSYHRYLTSNATMWWRLSMIKMSAVESDFVKT